MRNRQSTIPPILTALALLLGANTASALPRYVTVDLGAGSHSYAYGINNMAQIVGYRQVDGNDHAFMWERGNLHDLGTLGGSRSAAYAINNRGQIVGLSHTAEGPFHAFLFENGTMTDLTPGYVGSAAFAINEAGQTTGSAETPGKRAFLYADGALRILGDLPLGSCARSINERVCLAGSYYVEKQGAWTHCSFLYDPNADPKVVEIDCNESQAYGINDAGQVVGQMSGSGPAGRAFFYERGSITDLGEGTAFAINNSGLVVGYAHAHGAAVWENGVMMALPQGSGTALAVNDNGWIAGYDLNGAVLWAPEPNVWLVTPNAGEALIAGSNYAITWKTQGIIETVRIEYSSDRGISWSILDTVTDSAQYDWHVPDINSQECLVRVIDENDANIGDVSNDLFTMYVCQIPTDLTGDCSFDWDDFAILADNWLKCGNPFDSACQAAL